MSENLPEQPSRGGPSLRCHRPGDLGWVVSRHGALYHREYGFDETFEGLTAKIAGGYLESFDPRWERSWIAEIDGERAGCIFCMRQDEEVARLRMLLLEPAARGHGLGRTLVCECVDFARRSGYRRMVLTTVSILTAARRLYAENGFEIVATEPKRTWGCDLLHEDWALEL